MKRGACISRIEFGSHFFLRSFNLLVVFLSFTFYFANIQHRFEVLKELLFSSPLESFLFCYLFSIRFISKSVTRSDCQGFCILLGVKASVRIPHIVYIICTSLRFLSLIQTYLHVNWFNSFHLLHVLFFAYPYLVQILLKYSTLNRIIE